MRRSTNVNNYPYLRNHGKNYTNISWHKSNAAPQYNNMHDMRPMYPNYPKYNNFNKNLPPPNLHPPPTPTPTVSNQEVSVPRSQKKAKKKTLSTRTCRNWVREDAVKALELENEYLKSTTKAPTLLLRFPDPELDRAIVGAYSTDIESVHFQLNAAPRYCFVHLKEGADPAKVIENISKIPFGNGFVRAELRRTLPASSSNVDDVDPCTLYVGNLTNTISKRTIQEHFPNATRTDIGFAQRIKGTRYAILRYESVDKAMEDFKNTVNTMIHNRSIIVRFLRKKGLNMKNAHDDNEPEISANVHDLPTCNNQINNDNNDTLVNPIASISQDKSSSSNNSSNNVKRLRLSPNHHTSETGPTNTAAKVNEYNNSASTSCDSKDNVLSQASRLRASLSQKKEPTNEDSLGSQNSPLDVNTSNTTSIHPPQHFNIKQEIMEDDLSEDEVLSNILGARYNNAPMENIKREREDNAHIDERLNDNGQNSFEYDDEFDESEAEDEHWSNAQKMRQVNQARQMQQHGSCSDIKPSFEELQEQLHGGMQSTNAARENVAEHSSFVKKLYEEVKRMKESESNKRPRDDLDDLFAQMNSDNEDDDFF